MWSIMIVYPHHQRPWNTHCQRHNNFSASQNLSCTVIHNLNENINRIYSHHQRSWNTHCLLYKNYFCSQNISCNVLQTLNENIKCEVWSYCKKSFTGCERREIWSSVCRISLRMAWPEPRRRCDGVKTLHNLETLRSHIIQMFIFGSRGMWRVPSRPITAFVNMESDVVIGCGRQTSYITVFLRMLIGLSLISARSVRLTWL